MGNQRLQEEPQADEEAHSLLLGQSFPDASLTFLGFGVMMQVPEALEAERKRVGISSEGMPEMHRTTEERRAASFAEVE